MYYPLFIFEEYMI